MSGPAITLTTDFGAASPYVAAMKGALLAVNPAAQLVDLSHALPPQDLRWCSFFLRAALPYFPAGTLHVVVVDPGVGTAREVLYVETGGQQLLVPDNGCWTELARQSAAAPTVIRVTERRWWRPTVSSTFHGRDVFAPVAAYLSLGVPPADLGPRATHWAELSLAAPRVGSRGIDGEVVFVDDFGNLITNIAGEVLSAGRPAKVTVGEVPVGRAVRTYGEAEAGALVALVSSVGALEVAVVQGSAARKLAAVVGTPVRVEWSEAGA
jgi:S-adenosylmethionine hydrolase